MTLPAQWRKWKQRGFQQRVRSRKKQNGEEIHFFKLQDVDKVCWPIYWTIFRSFKNQEGVLRRKQIRLPAIYSFLLRTFLLSFLFFFFFKIQVFPALGFGCVQRQVICKWSLPFVSSQSIMLRNRLFNPYLTGILLHMWSDFSLQSNIFKATVVELALAF